MTTNFYAPPSAIRSGRVVLPDDESRHARTVLRAQAGNELVVVDGEGGWYRVQVDHVAPEQVVGSIVERRQAVREPSVEVTVGIGLLKKRSRFETFVEKAVELGVHRVVPLRTQHTEPESVRADRLQNVMIAAMKQCRRSRLPALSAPASIEEILAKGIADQCLLCHGKDDSVPIHRAAEAVASERSVLILVGPEGGFSASEAQQIVEVGGTPVSLGARRLRTETAGLVALSTVVSLHSARNPGQ